MKIRRDVSSSSCPNQSRRKQPVVNIQREKRAGRTGTFQTKKNASWSGVRTSDVKMGAKQHGSIINVCFGSKNLNPGNRKTHIPALKPETSCLGEESSSQWRRNSPVTDFTTWPSLCITSALLSTMSKSYSLRNPCPYGRDIKYVYVLLKLH